MIMKYTNTLLIPAILLLCACGDEPEVVQRDSQTTEPVAPPDTNRAAAATTDTVQSMYRFDQGEQHNWMKFTRVNDSVNGELHYTWEGKDGANGTIAGHFSGDTLWCIFSANMEGHDVQQEMAFLKSGDQMLEGQSTLAEDAKGVLRIKHRSMLEFDKQKPMKLTIGM